MAKAANLKRQIILARTKARQFLLQTLYLWQITQSSPEHALACALREHQHAIDESYFESAWQFITHHYLELEKEYDGHLSRPAQSLDPVERAILWIGAYEITQRPDIHNTIVLNECIELAKAFGGADSYKFINSALDNYQRALNSA